MQHGTRDTVQEGAASLMRAHSLCGSVERLHRHGQAHVYKMAPLHVPNCRLGRQQMALFWNDSAYSQFYASSDTERGLVNKTRDEGIAKLLSRHQLESFQAAFAEWSEGKGKGIRVADFRPFLAQLGLELSSAQARALWQDAAPEGAGHLPYTEALAAYHQVVSAPLDFRSAQGAAPPGKRLPVAKEVPVAGFGASAPEDRGPAQQPAAATYSASASSSVAEDAGGALALPLREARELLLEEGLPAADIEKFLAPFAVAGAAPQVALFDFLANWAGPAKRAREHLGLAGGAG